MHGIVEATPSAGTAAWANGRHRQSPDFVGFRQFPPDVVGFRRMSPDVARFRERRRLCAALAGRSSMRHGLLAHRVPRPHGAARPPRIATTICTVFTKKRGLGVLYELLYYRDCDRKSFTFGEIAVSEGRCAPSSQAGSPPDPSQTRSSVV